MAVQTARSCGSQAGSDCQPSPPGQARRGHQDQRLPDPRPVRAAETRRGTARRRPGRRRRWRSTIRAAATPGRLWRRGHHAGRQHERDGQTGFARDDRHESSTPAGDQLQRRLCDLRRRRAERRPGCAKHERVRQAAPRHAARCRGWTAGVQPRRRPGREIQPGLRRAHFPDRRRIRRLEHADDPPQRRVAGVRRRPVGRAAGDRDSRPARAT